MYRRKERIQVKTPEQLRLMRVAGLVVARTLVRLTEAARPGVTTGELDALAEDSIRSQGGTPSFLGYGHPPFPASICASVNDEVVHGIPGSRVLAEGDQISIDCGAIVDGWHGDSAVTVAVGVVGDADTALSRVTEGSLWAGLAAAQVGGRLSDIGSAVEAHVRAQPDGASYGILEEYVGHGIGTSMHMEPSVPKLRPRRARPQARGRDGAGDRADGHRRQPPRRDPRRRLDRRHQRRVAGVALGAHGRAHRRGPLGPHRARRRCGEVRRARGGLSGRPPGLTGASAMTGCPA